MGQLRLFSSAAAKWGGVSRTGSARPCTAWRRLSVKRRRVAVERQEVGVTVGANGHADRVAACVNDVLRFVVAEVILGREVPVRLATGKVLALSLRAGVEPVLGTVMPPMVHCASGFDEVENGAVVDPEVEVTWAARPPCGCGPSGRASSAHCCRGGRWWVSPTR